VFDALQWIVKTGASWRFLPHEFPPWFAVYQQARCWLVVGCFKVIAHDLHEVLRLAEAAA
jgi:transposase